MRISISIKIAFAFIIFLLLLSIMGTIAYRGLQDNVFHLESIEREATKQITAGNLRFTVTQLLMASNDFILTADPTLKLFFNEQNELIDKYYNEFTSLEITDNELTLLSQIKSDIDSIRYYSDLIFKINHPQASGEAIDYMQIIDYKYGYNINAKTTQIFDGIAQRIQDSKIKGEKLKEEQAELITRLIITGLLFSVIFMFLTINKIARPIKKLKSAAETIASGNYSTRPKINTKDEISSLAESFSNMAESISKAHKKISDDNLLLETIFSTIPSGLMVVDKDGKITTINKRMLEIINLDQSTIKQKTISRILENVNVSDDCKEYILHTKPVENYECVSTDLQGSQKYFGLSLLPVESSTKQNLLVADDITRHKEHQRRLDELQRFNQATLDSLTAYICVLDETGHIISINKAWKENAFPGSILLPQVSTGINYLQKIKSNQNTNKKEPSMVIEGIEDVIAGLKDQFNLEYLCNAQGEDRWFIIRVRPFEGSPTLPRKVVISHTDITDKKKAEIALKKSEERYRSLFESSPVGILIEDETGKILDANDSISRITGYSKKELIGESVKIFVPQSRKEILDRHINKLLSGQSIKYEIDAIKKDGSIIYCRLYETCILLPNGTREIISIAEDITENKSIEIQNNEMAERYSTLLETTRDGYWLIDKTGRMLDVNDNYCKMSGYTKNELLQMSIPDLEALETIEETKKHIEKIIEHGADRFETKHKRKDGTIWDVEINTIFWRRKEQFIVFAHDITERKQFESALMESEDKYRTVANYTYNWECWQSPNGKFNYVSPSCKRITGYDANEFINNPQLLLKITHPDDKEKLECHNKNIAEPTQELHQMEFRIITKEGKEKWISHICQSVYGSDNIYLGRRGSNRDITEQKLAEENILKLTKVVENSPVAIMITNKENKIEYANSYFIKQFSIKDKSEIFRQTPKIFQSGKTPDAIYKDMWSSLNKGKPWKGVIQDKDMDGKLIWFSTTITPIKDKKNNIISYAAIYLDITEQVNLLEELKKYKEHLEEMVDERTRELKESRETFRALTENSKDVIIRFNDKLQYVYINPAIETFIGLKPEEFIGKTHDELPLPKELAKLFDKSLKKVFKSKQNQRVEFKLPNGIWVDWFLFPEFDSEGNVTSVISSSRDITELKQMQLEIQSALKVEKELNELKDGFISMVSHEFRTPLTSILSSTELLEMGNSFMDSSKRDKHFRRIKSNIDDLIEMLNEVVYINKFNVGKIHVQKETIDLYAFCKNLLDEFVDLYPHIKSELDFQPEEKQYKLDPAIIKKILGNIISNAFKYNKSKEGFVKLIIKRKNNILIFQIEDNGMGIHPDDQKNIFDAFFRSSSTQNIQGTGLGLNIVEKLVKQLKGRILLNSELNKGTKFTVLIPIN